MQPTTWINMWYKVLVLILKDRFEVRSEHRGTCLDGAWRIRFAYCGEH